MTRGLGGGGTDVKIRKLLGAGLAIAMALALSGVPALAGPAARESTESRARSPLITVDWRRGPSSTFAGTRFDGEYVAAVGRVYFLGFRTLGDATDGSVWYFDTATRSYTDTGVDMPVPVSNYGIAALTDSNGLGLYIFGGRDAAAKIVKSVQVYYPATNTAAVVSSDRWPGTTPAGCTSLPAMGVASVSNRAVVMGGLSFAANGCVDDQSAQTWVFDPTRPAGSRWMAGPDLNMARGYITPAVIGGRIYAVGGDTIDAGALIPTAKVEAWMPPGGGWNDGAVADLPTPCDESQAFGLTAPRMGIVLAGCGQWPNAVPDTYVYNAAVDRWSFAGSLNDTRRNHAGALVVTGDARVMYILGGYGESSQFIDPLDTSELSRVRAAAPGSPRQDAGAGARSVPTS